MQETQLFFPQDLYLKHLSILSNIHFTTREIDVMTCIISARRTSKIASLLSINTRTVETHIRNIMLKLECNSQEGIIDFIETSGKLPYLRKYYALLRAKIIFEKSLASISKLNKEKKPLCFLIQKGEKNSFITHLISHLELAGIKVSTSAHKKEEDPVLFILPKKLAEEEIYSLLHKIKQSPNKTIFLLRERKNNKKISKELINLDVIDFEKQENYYFSFFNLLKKIIPHTNFDQIISEFKDKYDSISTKTKLPTIPSKEGRGEYWIFNRKVRYALLILFITGIVASGFFALRWHQKNTENILFRSDLILPRNSVLLDRSALLKEIEDALNKEDGIQTIALIGVGGAGKTMLARQYAHQKKMNSMWEINAETQESLHRSFEKLAHALAKTEADQKNLKYIQEIGDSTEKENKLIQFVKERLRSKSNWLLIYDNVVTFADIQKHFPYDTDTWGQGKIILTTRDGNIGNNEHVNHVIFIGELSPEQKFTLFTKIMQYEKNTLFSSDHNEETKLFLNKIPSFPLDVSIAAYYLKATNTPYSTYLENLAHFNKDFMHIQENVLREVGEYSKVRYCIVTSSLRKILEEHREFEELLLTLFLFDSQNIPRDLLNTFKDNVLVSNFIFNLKKYSLLTSGSSDSRVSPTISVHHSTQAIGLYYLQQKLGLERNKDLIKPISEKLVGYIEKIIKEEDIIKMRSLIHHCKAFLKHKKLLTSDIEGIIKGQLGIIYYFLGDNIKAKSFFEESLSILERSHEKHPMYIALYMGYLGNALRDLGDYDKAKMLIEKAIPIYEKYYPKDNLKYAYFLVYLGVIERYLGHYDAARGLFEKGVTIHKEHFPENKNYMAWVSGQLAILDREVGNYEHAKNILETSLQAFKKERSSDHLDIAWALEHLGIVYTKLNQYEKAKETLEQSLRIYAVYLPDQIGPSWILALCDPLQSSKNYEDGTILFNKLPEIYKVRFHDNYVYIAYPLSKLGNLYTELGDYKKAKILLEQSLSIYQKNYGEQHLTVGQTLNEIGQVYLREGKLKKSEDLLIKSLKILQQNNHLDSYICLENLSDLFLKKSLLARRKEDSVLSLTFRTQSISFLKQALDIAASHLEKDSFHILRIQEKLKKLNS